MKTASRSLPDPLITATPERLGGAPVFAGTRVPLKTFFEYLEGGEPLDAFLVDFPNVSREHAIAVLEFAQDSAVAQSTGVAAE